MANRRRSFIALVVSVFCALVPLHAQQQEPRAGGAPAAQRETQRPGPEVRRLAFLMGAWEEKVTYPGETPEQKNEGGSGRWFARPVMGRFLQINYEGTGPQGAYRAFGVLAYEREAQGYRLFWFDDSGGVGDYHGNFVDDNNLSLEHRGKVDGRDFRERITYTRVSPTEIHTKIEQAWDAGEYRIYLEATATRTGAALRGPMRRESPPAKPPVE